MPANWRMSIGDTEDRWTTPCLDTDERQLGAGTCLMQRSCAGVSGIKRSPGRDMHYEQSLEAWGTEIMPACGQGRDWAASRPSHGSVVDRHSRECTPVPCGQWMATVAELDRITGMKQGARGEGRSKQGANANRGQWGCTGAGTHSGPELLEPAGRVSRHSRMARSVTWTDFDPA